MSMDKTKIKRAMALSFVAIGTAFAGLSILAKVKKTSSVYEDVPKEKNPMEGKKVIFIKDNHDKENADGVKGHLEAVGDSDYRAKVYDKYIKRIIDIILSFGGLIVLAPVFAIIALAIVIEDPGPVLFSQKRIGQNKKYFKLHKFRSMKVNDEADSKQATVDDPRKTRFGNFLRRSNIDELPQFINVFRGDMSIVGPRPHMLAHTETYARLIDKYMVRHFIKPGVTGWAQTHGFRGETRELSQMEERVKADIWYMEHWTLLLDLYIIYKTIANVVVGEKNAY